MVKQFQQKQPRQKLKNDPKFPAAARELRDQYLEQVNAGDSSPMLTDQKYEVSRALSAEIHPARLLPAA